MSNILGIEDLSEFYYCLALQRCVCNQLWLQEEMEEASCDPLHHLFRQ